MQQYQALASRFIDNFKKFEAGTPPEVIAAGPRIDPSVSDRPNWAKT
jgi:hypothetical protein